MNTPETDNSMPCIVVPPTEEIDSFMTRNGGRKPSEYVKNFHVFYPPDHYELEDIYEYGVVIEEWQDGRWYFINGNCETIGSFEEVWYDLINFILSWGYVEGVDADIGDPCECSACQFRAKEFDTGHRFPATGQLEGENGYVFLHR